MVRGLFTNKSTNNRLAPNLSPGHAIHASSGRVLPLWQAAAEAYARESRATVIIAAIENSGEIATLRAGGLISAIIGDILDSDAAGIGRVSDVP